MVVLNDGLISLPGIMNLPTQLCFAYVTFFKCRPCHLTFGCENGWTDHNTNCCVNTIDEKIPMAKIWSTLVQ